MKRFITWTLSVLCLSIVLTGCSTPQKITQAQIDEINVAFETLLPVKDDQFEFMVNPICNFFGSSYEKPSDMDFTQFIWYFSTPNMLEQPPISEEEFQLLRETEGFPSKDVSTLKDMPVPIQRKPLKEVNQILEQYMGITAADLDTKDIPYLGEPYNAFYTYTSDAGFMGFYCTGGEINGNTVKLFSDYAVLTLEKKDDQYLITSHVTSQGQ